MPFTFLHNLNLVQSKKNRSKKCSILIENDKIFKIISNHSEEKQVVNYLHNNFFDFQIFNLEGGYIIPGFTDSHTHLLAHGIERQRIDLSKCHSLDECLEKLNIQKNKDVIFGVNWDESCWTRGRKEDLNRRILDKISKNKPVIMRRVCGHFAVCNSEALKYFSDKWKIVDRKNGYLYEDPALYLNQIFKPSFVMYKKGLELATKEALSLGITSINEITDITGFKIYQTLKNRLNLRVALYLQCGLFLAMAMGLQSNFGDELLKFVGVKLFMDGSIGARTAAVKNPYEQSKNRGKLLIYERSLRNIVKTAEMLSIQLMIHSIGDRATDIVLKAFNDAGIGTNRLRHRLEHLEMLNTKQIKDIARLNLIASMQPNFLRWQSAGNMYEKNLGLRYKEMNCFKKVKDAGIRLIFGSDCMPLGPLYGINLTINNSFGTVRLTPAEAIRLYTETAPYATFDEDKKGKIEDGKLADIVVLNKNPLIKKNYDGLKILMVFVNGRIVPKTDKSTNLL